MLPEDQKLIDLIEKKARTFYDTLDFAHNATHGERVVKIAKVIAEKEKSNHFLVVAGAWLHQYHDNLGDLQRLFSEVNMSEFRKNALFEIVKNCRPLLISENATIETKIVFDADALDLVGSFGAVRELLCNAVVRDMNWIKNVKKVKNVQQLFIQKIQTATGREISKQTIKITKMFWEDYNNWLLNFDPNISFE